MEHQKSLGCASGSFHSAQDTDVDLESPVERSAVASQQVSEHASVPVDAANQLADGARQGLQGIQAASKPGKQKYVYTDEFSEDKRTILKTEQAKESLRRCAGEAPCPPSRMPIVQQNTILFGLSPA